MIVQSDQERAGIIEAGRRLGAVLGALEQEVRPGITTGYLDEVAERLIREKGDEPAFKGYTPEGARYPFPAALCISVNDEIVHGIPGDRMLKEGDIVSLDLGLIHDGLFADSAVTVPVGTTDKTSYALMNATRVSLERGIEAARPGKRIGDISYATGQALNGTGFAVVKVLGGHGVGRSVHEDPYIANDGHPGTGIEIVPGMVLALEPIANAGKASVLLDNDGYTYRTRDGSRSAHFEHTILIEEKQTLVVTRRPGEQVVH
ncbi:MAG TPA: type I methionyl aminopeptidase [Candidatus Paceibacterota bacterium]|jgi:methionyl aminopeptidase